MNKDDLEAFLGAAIEAVDITTEEDVITIFMVNETDDTLLCMAVQESEGLSPGVTAQMDQMMAMRPYFAAMATKVSWSPDESPTKPAWLLIGVDPERTAEFCVRRIDVDDKWWRIPPDDVPWFALSTAGSLRGAMVNGTPLRPKNASQKPDLWKKPSELMHPETDERGEL